MIEAKKVNRPKEIPFPKLMEAPDGEVWLATDHKEGVIVSSTRKASVGLTSLDLHTKLLRDYTGTITLENVWGAL